MVDGKKALYGNTEARILENEEWSSNLVDALHHMSELMQGNVISAQARYVGCYECDVRIDLDANFWV